MKAIRVQQFGGPEVLTYEEMLAPQPGPGQVLIKVEAAGLNFIEIYQRLGQYPMALPYTPGGEFAGTVERVGEGVTEFKPGDRVGTASGTGGYAEYALAPAAKLIPIPEEMTAQQVAAVILQGMTAHYLAVDTFPLKPGHSALVHAAAGGTGALLVQIAKLRGARVIATVSTAEKAAIAKASGADEVINYVESDFEAETRRLTDGKGVDVVYDSVGKDTFDKSLNVLRPRGYMALYGQSSGPVPSMNPQILNQKGALFLTRPTLAYYTATRDELLGRAQDLFTWIAAGKLTLRIDQTFPLAEASKAHEYMAGRRTKGKVLLIP